MSYSSIKQCVIVFSKCKIGFTYYEKIRICCRKNGRYITQNICFIMIILILRYVKFKYSSKDVE